VLRLAPQHRHQAVAQLTRREYRSARGVRAWLPAVVTAPRLAASAVYITGRLMGSRYISV
jgi:cation transport regulator ChaC